MGYLIIIPVKNEEKFIVNTLNCIINQSYLPELCVIVDDGSVDNSVSLIEKTISGHFFFKLIILKNHLEKRGYGSKVIKAFNKGLAQLNLDKYDFLVKLDADLTLPNNYFEAVNDAFLNNTKLGITGGIIVEQSGDFERKLHNTDYVQGAIKSIKIKCFHEIGGFKEINGWDGHDQLSAIYLGWEVRNLPLKVEHHRIEALEYASLKYYGHNGLTHYLLGNNLILAILRSIYQLPNRPYFLASFSYLLGYIYGAIFIRKRTVSKEFAKFTINYHYKKMFKKMRKC